MRLIDADALVNKWRTSLNITENDTGAVFVGYSQIPAMINNMPTIEERKKGKWIDCGFSDEVYAEVMKCPFCGAESFGGNFCDYCGADMRGEDDGKENTD